MVIGGALLALLLYLAVPRLTTAYAENAHLKQTLAAKDAELARAHAQISELSTQRGEPAAMGAGRGQPRRPPAAGGRRHRRWSSRPPTSRSAPPPPRHRRRGGERDGGRRCWPRPARSRGRRAAPHGCASRRTRRRTAATVAARRRSRTAAATSRRRACSTRRCARAPAGELIFLSVGDTRDHRREIKDPALKTISVDFLNLLANLKQLRIDHYVILTTRSLCRSCRPITANTRACGPSCGTTTRRWRRGV